MNVGFWKGKPESNSLTASIARKRAAWLKLTHGIGSGSYLPWRTVKWRWPSYERHASQDCQNHACPPHWHSNLELQPQWYDFLQDSQFYNSHTTSCIRQPDYLDGTRCSPWRRSIIAANEWTDVPIQHEWLCPLLELAMLGGSIVEEILHATDPAPRRHLAFQNPIDKSVLPPCFISTSPSKKQKKSA